VGGINKGFGITVPRMVNLGNTAEEEKCEAAVIGSMRESIDFSSNTKVRILVVFWLLCHEKNSFTDAESSWSGCVLERQRTGSYP
jgi:hypothetical protein